jgi:hypothetical protein
MMAICPARTRQRPKAASEIENLQDARSFLGHTNIAITKRVYLRMEKKKALGSQGLILQFGGSGEIRTLIQTTQA